MKIPHANSFSRSGNQKAPHFPQHERKKLRNEGQLQTPIGSHDIFSQTCFQIDESIMSRNRKTELFPYGSGFAGCLTLIKAAHRWIRHLIR